MAPELYYAEDLGLISSSFQRVKILLLFGSNTVLDGAIVFSLLIGSQGTGEDLVVGRAQKRSPLMLTERLAFEI